MRYDVFYQNECVGNVYVKSEGLYTCFQSSIQLKNLGFFRLKLIARESFVNLGLFMPYKDGYQLKKSLPKNKLPEGDWVFSVFSEEENLQGDIPIEEGKAFPMLHRLQEGKLVFHNGKAYFSLQS